MPLAPWCGRAHGRARRITAGYGRMAGYTDADIAGLLDENVREWCRRRLGGRFTPPQRMAVPLIREGKNVLICSPTGSGKTLAAFLSIIDGLVTRAQAGELQDSVYCLYVSPLK